MSATERGAAQAPVMHPGPLTGVGWRRARWLVLTALGILAVVAACMPGYTPAINGTFSLNAPDNIDWTATTCRGTGGYSDIAPGLDVVVKDGEGKIIGTSSLELVETSNASQCLFSFSVDVPDADFYSISVGRRGEVTYSRDELRERVGIVSLSLGDS